MSALGLVTRLISIAADELEADGHWDHATRLHRIASELRLAPDYNNPGTIGQKWLQLTRQVVAADRNLIDPENSAQTVQSIIHQLSEPPNAK